MTVTKERFVSLLGKFHVVAKKCRKILVLQGTPWRDLKMPNHPLQFQG